ncbi:MAG: acetoin utilization protein AcuC, partial [Actinomycetota bacterium]
AHLRLTTAAYREAAAVVHDLAHEVAGGRWFATGGGGYERARVVPLAWTLWFAGMRGVAVPDGIPDAWRRSVEAATGTLPPATFSEPAEPDDGRGDDAVDAAARAILGGTAP